MIEQILAGATVTIETAISPPITVPLAGLVGGEEPSPLMKALRPSVRVERNGALIYQAAPHGAPDAFDRKFIWAAAAAALVLLLLYLFA